MMIDGKNPNYQIRLAGIDDLPALPAIEQRAGQQFAEVGLGDIGNLTLPMETLIEAKEEGRVWVIATTAAEIIGFALVSVKRESLHLEEIDIDPAHSRQGLGRALISAICHWAKANGFKAMSLATFRDIPWNAPYYERLGFRIIPVSQLADDLIEVREAEARLGLPMNQRVIMVKPL
jgi:GNAT superfamily N-acetyltransferase